jgi:hypothetical protein
MGNFSDILAAADLVLTNTFSKKTTSGDSLLTLYPLSGDDGVQVFAIERNPMLEDDYVPGAQTGTTNLKLFIRPDAIPTTEVQKGMRAAYGGVDYDVIDVSVDREGGAVLTMKKRSIPRARS